MRAVPRAALAPPPGGVRPLALRLLFVGLAGLAGCAGQARMELAALDFKTIDPPPGRVSVVQAHECYWWLDEQQRVWVAWRRHWRQPWQPHWDFQLDVSVRLDTLPAGKARNYKLDRQSLRMRFQVGPWQLRIASLTGIAALYRDGPDRLRGSLRMQAFRRTAQLFGGWGKPVRYLVLARFTAVRDRRRGEPIARATESDGWERSATPSRHRASTRPSATSSASATSRPSAASRPSVTSSPSPSPPTP